MYVKLQSPLSLTDDVSTEIYDSKAIYLLLNLILASLSHFVVSVWSESSSLHILGSLERLKRVKFEWEPDFLCRFTSVEGFLQYCLLLYQKKMVLYFVNSFTSPTSTVIGIQY